MLLVQDGIEVNKTRTNDGTTPLNIACNSGQTEIIRLLLGDGRVNIHKVNNEGETPLHTSAWTGNLLAAQLCVVYGARLIAVNDTGDTSAEAASANDEPVLAEWLDAVSGWSHLRVAAGCRLYKDAAVALRLGRIDPDDDGLPQPAVIKEMIMAIATSKAELAALPWRDAPPICKETTTLVVAATRGWSRTTHWWHHGKVREAVFAVLVVARRLKINSDALAALVTSSEHDGDGDTDALATLTAPLPVVLPIEIWTFLMQFFKRSWWEAGFNLT